MNKFNKRDTYLIRIKEGKILDTARTKIVASKLLEEQKLIQRRDDIIIENTRKELK